MTWKPVGIKSAAHSSDVKACARIDGDKVVTTGRDGAVRVWQFTTGQDFEELLSYSEHEGFVNSVAFIPSTSEFPRGIIASGGKDKLINLWDYAGKQLCGTLIGHDDNICKLAVFEETSRAAPFVLASTSWDGSARCWTEELSPASCLVLSAAEASSCWSCAALGRDAFVTGHGDKSLRIWRGEQQVQVIANAHRDVVRDLLAVGQGCFLSVGNDGVLKVWDAASGTALQTVNYAHPAFIYGLAWNGSDRVVSFGEEGAVKVWKWLAEEKRIEEEASLRVPMTSAWCATFLNASILLVGGSTGSLYVFSSLIEDNDDITNLLRNEMAVFDAEVHASKSAELEKNAQDESVLRYPGERVGKTILVRRQATQAIEAHQWDGAEWQFLGEAVDPLAVKAPDFNFKVNLDDSGRMYDLPYSHGENPYSVAKNFLERNDLGIGHLDEVAQFIIKNAGVNETVDVGNSENTQIKEPGNLRVEAYNAEGVLSKLRAFGMPIEQGGDASIDDIAVALKTWPTSKLFPCLDWLRVRVLTAENDDCTPLFAVVPIDKILEEGTRPDSEKECVAAVTMFLRLLCNTNDIRVDCVKVIGKCSQSLSSKNSSWIPLLIGLLYNKRQELEASKKMALLHGLLTKIRGMNFSLGADEVARIFWLVKGVKMIGSVPLGAAIKKEVEGIKELLVLLQLL